MKDLQFCGVLAARLSLSCQQSSALLWRNQRTVWIPPSFFSLQRLTAEVSDWWCFFVMLIHLVDSGQGIDSLIHISQVSGSDSSDFCLITNLRFSDQWGVSIPSGTSACLGKIYSGFLAEKLYTVSSLSWVRGLPINGLLFAQKAAVFSH